MANFFLVRSKKEMEKNIFRKMLFNLKNDYLNHKEDLIKFKSKKFNYYIGIKSEEPNKIFEFNNEIIMIFSGSVYNLENNSLKYIFSEYLKHGISFLKKHSFSLIISIKYNIPS